MAAHDTPTNPSGRLAALVGISPTDLAEIRADVARRAENEALRLKLETATADLARAHCAMMAVVRSRVLADAHRVADDAVVELAVAHAAALHGLETIGQPTQKGPATIVPFPGRRA
ncbi:hypothetical protein [Methylobacterium aquaticum]|uniref:Uncharacterized protein n=1 Tax=Methylobacterium aquaticum TaxID=270351 RepID=A0A0C6F6P2_9HYPH|nr:hypothetical protein [Methylobacterium aquaticum]BAQ44003.1 hypothetical protein Maq22A_c02695 [Methylobacterium aquaticum]